MYFKKEDLFEINCEFKQEGLSLVADLRGIDLKTLINNLNKENSLKDTNGQSLKDGVNSSSTVSNKALNKDINPQTQILKGNTNNSNEFSKELNESTKNSNQQNKDELNALAQSPTQASPRFKELRPEGLISQTPIKAVRLSLKDESIKEFSEFIALEDGGFELNLEGLYEPSYLRVEFQSEEDLLNANLKLFQRRHHLIISRRSDAFGSRMFSQLNAMFFAKKFGFKFGFVWDNTRLKDIEYCQTDTEYEVFSQEYLEKYSYTSLKLPFTQPAQNGMPASFWLMKDALTAPLYESFGHVASYYRPAWQNMKDLSEDEYKKEFKALFDSIDFSPTYKELLKKADLGFEYEALHMRESEIVYYWKHRIFPLLIYYFPQPLILDLVRSRLKENKKIMLFCDDQTYAKDIKAHFSQSEQVSIFIASDFLPKTDLSKAKNAFFELMLMSKATVIYGSMGSMFKLFASYLGGIKQVTINELWTPQEQYDLIKKDLNKFKLSNEDYKLCSLALLHHWAYRVLKKDEDECIEIVEKMLEIDPTNLGCKIKLASLYIKKGDFNKAGEFYKEAIELNQNYTVGLLRGEYKEDLNLIALNFDKNIYLCWLNTLCNPSKDEVAKLKQAHANEVAKLKEQWEKAKKFKEHLSYKLGEALMRAYSKMWSGQLMYFFCYEAWKIKREFKEKKAQEEALKELSQIEDQALSEAAKS
ncbi:tetratricopeptide repeat protein [Campylobacter troglodytis]|uniref:tetratricopeptide repeat protein n=1 Tax=Campylobacter troglodytis TaxID=654363 RepID=UPI001157D1D5|nr:hypothetical protein [Campylobacter troglodytis]TQR60914.1 hypothetical protein DMC01_03600 [Campylobacter troglodytis]